MAEISMNAKAYVKPLLHAAKYPHCAVNGVLLAELTKNKDGKAVKLVDAVPLFHSSLTLAPMMEVALTQVEAFCKSQSYVIAGYYQANENFDNSKCERSLSQRTKGKPVQQIEGLASITSPTGIALRLGDKLKENFSEACLIMVDNSKALTDCDQAYILYTNSDGKWKKADKKISAEKDAADISFSLIKSRAYRSLVDFDNHLDDISASWQNHEINEQIA